MSPYQTGGFKPHAPGSPLPSWDSGEDWRAQQLFSEDLQILGWLGKPHEDNEACTVVTAPADAQQVPFIRADQPFIANELAALRLMRKPPGPRPRLPLTTLDQSHMAIILQITPAGEWERDELLWRTTQVSQQVNAGDEEARSELVSSGNVLRTVFVTVYLTMDNDSKNS